MPRIAHAVAVLVGTLLLLVGAVAGVVDHEVLDADRFTAHADAVRTDPDVSEQVGGLVADRLLERRPALVAVAPAIRRGATEVVRSPRLTPLVRSGVTPVYQALLDGDPDPVVLSLDDVVAQVVARMSTRLPGVVLPVPAGVEVRLSDLGAGTHTGQVVRWMHLVGVLAWLAPLLGVLVLAGAGWLGPGPGRVRGAARSLGTGAIGASVVLAAGLLVAGLLVRHGERDTLAGAVRTVVWDRLAPPCWVAVVVLVVPGLVLVLAAARPLDRTHALRRAVLPAAVGLAGVVLVAGVVVAAGTDDHHLAAAADPGACNGHVELCDRAYDDVAYPATHNAMAAASLPGWFFPEQPDGIVDQLDHGIRVLLVDSWYGRAAARHDVVITEGEERQQALADARRSFGAAAVDRVLRLQDAAGLTPRGPVRSYLCHAMCELGSTPWLDSLRATRAWLADHPREVVTLFVQDEVSPADTADLIEEAGLLPYVATPPTDGRWPTLGQMIESGRRLVVLMEHHGGGSAYPWLAQGFDFVQDTPYDFGDVADFSCAPNRGRADASLLLVNHWITDKRAEVTNASRVNARDVLGPRVEQCSEERGMLPNFVAVDFYDRGDLLDVVDELNGLP